VVRKIFGLKKKTEVTEGCRQHHDVESNDVYPSPNVIGVIKLRRMRLAGHVAQI
jgi:hypothetical protein